MRHCIAALGAFLLTTTVCAEPIELHCWIVADDFGVTLHSSEAISNSVVELNKIYSQVGMSFCVRAISCTNSTYLTRIVFTNDMQKAELYSLSKGSSGLKIYFVESITDATDAFHGKSGIVISKANNRTTLAHEVGHACGLCDIYDFHPETDYRVQGGPSEERFTQDWGWYPENESQVSIIRRLLMYGYNTGSKGDISGGNVYGLWYQTYRSDDGEVEKDWQLGLAPVGFSGANRNPRSN